MASLISRALFLGKHASVEAMSAQTMFASFGGFRNHVHLRFAREARQFSQTSIDLAFDWYPGIIQG